MRIKRLELCGFKSFVDPTVLEFSAGVSGIVGPNGCGKSNLVDALRWVLGEQSAKRLRGGAMEDVIFNGTDASRGPSGMAEVSLLLENDGLAPGEMASDVVRALHDAPEIQVTRRYFRSGESEYLINSRPCRLKDVTELFLGTGVGAKAYAMIEQGKVDQLVNAKPEDLRLFIEEAAGTTLYRDRRLAAERKLERTRDNLARVNDILQEIDRTIALYRRMAKRAEQYRRDQDELRGLELQLGRREFDRLSADAARLGAACAALREREAALGGEIEELDRRREGLRADVGAAETDLEARSRSLLEIRRARERASARLEMLEKEEADAVQQALRCERDREQSSLRLEEVRAEIERRQAALEVLHGENLASGERLASSAASVRSAEERAGSLAEALEAAKTEIVERLRVESELRNQIRGAERRTEELGRRREAMAAERAGLEAEAVRLVAEAERVAAARLALEDRARAAQAEHERVAATAERLRGEKAALEKTALALAASLAEAQSRLSSAEELERGWGRYQEGVQAVMRRHAEAPNGVMNLVAEVLDAPPELEKAVAAVLGERLQYVIVRRPEDARDAVAALKAGEEGRSNFVPVDPRRAVRDEHHGRDGLTGLLELVRVEEGYGGVAEHLLGDAVLVPDLDHALELWRRNGKSRTFVTPDGEVVHPSGAVSGGSAGPYEERLLAQRREIRRLRVEVERLAGEHADVERRRGERAAELGAAERAAASQQEVLRQAALDRVGLDKDRERAEEGRARVAKTLARLEADARHVDAELETVRAEAAEAERRLGEGAAERAGREDERRRLDEELRESRAVLERENAAATELKVSLAQSREKEGALREGLCQMQAQRDELERRLREVAAEAESLAARAGSRAAEIAGLRDETAARGAEEAGEQKRFDESRERVESLRTAIGEIETALAETRTTLDAVREDRSRGEMTLREQTLRLEHVVEGIRERYAVELAEVALEDADEAALRTRAEELRQKVDRYDRSQVGAETVGELAEEEARREFLTAQKADLESSVADLAKTIANLNRLSRDRFAETFAAVNEKFQQTFPKLFRGGRARLVYTDESNLLETGVDIEVQPPGMNLKTLSLLSGGQKALTAVSLIFSLFMCRPSPFCVLDEVDAPLDDANIDRFNEMVKEMGAVSQFLLITHNQRTMEVADALYGVTMEEAGVSKIVSVRLDSAA